MFRVTNGVKQGGVLSPVLFSIILTNCYTDIYWLWLFYLYVVYGVMPMISIIRPIKHALSEMHEVACEFVN